VPNSSEDTDHFSARN